MKTLREIETWDEFYSLLAEGDREEREMWKEIHEDRKNDHKEWLENQK